MEKQLAMFLLKVWSITIVLAPFALTLIMRNRLGNSNDLFANIVLNIAIPLFLGLFFFIPSLIMTLIVSFICLKLQMKWTAIKLISNVSLFLFMGIQLLFLYQNNLCLIYNGEGTMVACYAIMLVLTSAVLYRFNAKEQAA